MTRLSIAALGLLATLTCFAHTPLKASSPAADAAVTAPTALALEFGGEVRLTSLSLTDSAGGAKHLEAVPTAIASKFELAIHEPLAPGDYTVVWRAVGGDTHIVSGEFKFKVVAAPAR